MHGRLAMLLFAGGLAWAAAAPVNPRLGGPATVPANLAQEASEYARAVMEFMTQVIQSYYQKVALSDLAEAAVIGLYEAARQPPPAGLHAEVQAAKTTAEISRMLIRERLALGADASLRGNLAVQASIQSLPRALDPFSGPTSTARDIYNYYESTLFGVGLEFTNLPPPRPNADVEIRNRRLVPRAAHPEGQDEPVPPLRIKSVVPGSPAQEAGLRPGDQIMAIDGQRITRLNRGQCEQHFFPASPATNDGKVPPAFRIDVARAGRDMEWSIKITPDDFTPETVFGVRRAADGEWDFVLDAAAGLAYARLGPIIATNGTPQSDGRSSATELYSALLRLREAGARGLLLDLRWCPGGYLDPAVQIARCLLPDDVSQAELDEHGMPVAERPLGIAISSNRRQGRTGPELVSAYKIGDPITDLPLVVLVNAETSGGGEMIAAALQDHHRAVIAGDRTRGKASIQNTLDVNATGEKFKITTGIFRRANGKNLHRFSDSTSTDDWGVRPDSGRWLPVSPEAARQVKEMWMLHALRPAGSREAIAADDPEADPQLRAAIEMLRALAKKPPSGAS